MQLIPMQKVLHLKDELKKKTPSLLGDWFIQPKIEGWYIQIYFDVISQEWTSPYASSGRLIPSLLWMKQLLNEKLPKLNFPCMLEAEAWQDMPFEKLNGILNRSKGDCSFKDIILKFHNLVRLDGIAQYNYFSRYTLLKALFTDCKLEKIPQFSLIENLYVGSFNTAINEHYFDEIVSAGGEGIILRKVKAVYMPGKRNANILKQKMECEKDCLAVALETGIGEKGNPSLTLISKRKSGAEIRTVISKHSLIDEFTANPSNIIGKVVKIKAMSEYEDGQLRQPVFQYVREDKNAADYD